MGWDYAEVLEVLPSSEDGRVRSVRLRIGRNETTRPIVKLHPLLSAKELRPEGQNNDTPSQSAGDSSPGQPATEQQTESNDEPTIDQTPNSAAQAEGIVHSRPSRAAKAAGRDKI